MNRNDKLDQPAWAAIKHRPPKLRLVPPCECWERRHARTYAARWPAGSHRRFYVHGPSLTRPNMIDVTDFGDSGGGDTEWTREDVIELATRIAAGRWPGAAIAYGPSAQDIAARVARILAADRSAPRGAA